MCNRLYKHFSGNNILYRKQVSFQAKHSIEHAIMQLVHTVDQKILITK